eukprot:11077383-Heterocapsa_arctica.AAC.1
MASTKMKAKPTLHRPAAADVEPLPAALEQDNCAEDEEGTEEGEEESGLEASDYEDEPSAAESDAEAVAVPEALPIDSGLDDA